MKNIWKQDKVYIVQSGITNKIENKIYGIFRATEISSICPVLNWRPKGAFQPILKMGNNYRIHSERDGDLQGRSLVKISNTVQVILFLQNAVTLVKMLRRVRPSAKQHWCCIFCKHLAGHRSSFQQSWSAYLSVKAVSLTWNQLIPTQYMEFSTQNVMRKTEYSSWPFTNCTLNAALDDVAFGWEPLGSVHGISPHTSEH